jgi:hypothetical protein
MPYVTNRKVTFVKTIEAIVCAIANISELVFSGMIQDCDYVMIQPKMFNNYEYKVACFGMRAQYIAERKRASGKSSYRIFSDAAVMDFAEHAIATLAETNPAAILDGLVRVDIFRTSSNPPRLVVNEFESLEARYNSTIGTNESDMDTDLTGYWFVKIRDCINSIDTARTVT